MLKTGIVTNDRRDTFLNFIRVPENQTGSAGYAPLTLAMVVLKTKAGYLLAFHRYREKWEIPGGHIDRGETPRQAARRELREETGQTVQDLHFEGLVQLQLHPDNRIEYGALYSFEVPNLQPFSENSEISRIILWDRRTVIDKIDEIDKALINLVADPPPSSEGPGLVHPDDGSRILDCLRSPLPDQTADLRFTAILARLGPRYLVVYNNRRRIWEFPTGGIEKGESWLDCARRETGEESGQTLHDPRLALVVRGYFPQRQVTARGAIVTATLTEINPFQSTAEIGRISLWNPLTDDNCLDFYNRSILNLVIGPSV